MKVREAGFCSFFTFLLILALFSSRSSGSQEQELSSAPGEPLIHPNNIILPEEDSLFFLSDNLLERRLSDVVVNECLDATEWFSWSRFDGVNVLATHYTCQCSGDLQSAFTLNCVARNICFTRATSINEDPQQVCVNRDVTYDFTVDPQTGFLETPSREVGCIEYSKGGPTTGRLCARSFTPCAITVRNQFFQSTESSTEICRNQDTCPTILVNNFGFSTEEATAICPVTTLAGQRCNSNVGSRDCQVTGQESAYAFAALADCSNVEACATTTCQALEAPRNNTTPSRTVWIYPECAGKTRAGRAPGGGGSSAKSSRLVFTSTGWLLPVSIATLMLLALV